MTSDPLAIPGATSGHFGRTGSDASFVSSRLRVLESLAANASAGRGWLFLTGEAGTGKSLLLEALSHRLPSGWDAVGVELTPESTPNCLVEALSEAIGSRLNPIGDPLRFIRQALSRAAIDSRRLVLLVDEGQNASDLVLETIRLLAGRIGQEDGLAALVLAGQTPLLSRLSTAGYQSVRNRMAAHFHLRGLDLAESADLLGLANLGRAFSAGELEDQHRRLLGNPRLLLRLASSAPTWAASARRVDSPEWKEAGTPAEPLPFVSPESQDSRRPPLRIEEGLIEVGVPDPETDLTGEPIAHHLAAAPTEMPVQSELGGPVAISDLYADIQSRQEWEQLRGRIGVPTRSLSGVGLDPEPQVAGRATRIRAETSHETRPLSRLFSRLDIGPDTDDEIS
jgi:general secretion pathway protein A